MMIQDDNPDLINKNTYMLFAGWEVRMVKNCDRGLENAARFKAEVTVFHHTDRPLAGK